MAIFWARVALFAFYLTAATAWGAVTVMLVMAFFGATGTEPTKANLAIASSPLVALGVVLLALIWEDSARPRVRIKSITGGWNDKLET